MRGAHGDSRTNCRPVGPATHRRSAGLVDRLANFVDVERPDGCVPSYGIISPSHRGHLLRVERFSGGVDYFPPADADGACHVESGLRLANADPKQSSEVAR